MLGIRHTENQFEVKNGNDVLIYILECIEIIHAYICEFTGILIIELLKLEKVGIMKVWDVI